MITGVHAIGLAVTDVERTAAALGAAVDLERVESAGLRGPNVHLALTRAASAGPPRPVPDAGITHLCLQQREIAPLRYALEAGGWRFLSEPVDLDTGFLYAYGHDPDGLLYETEGAPFAPAEPRSWFGHLAFATPDLERLSGFYAALLDRPATRPMRLRGAAKYDRVTGLSNVDVRAAWVPGLNLSLEFWQYLNPPTRPAPQPEGQAGYTHLTLESDDPAADLERAAALGATVEQSPTASADGERAVFLDPDGNRVELVRWSAERADLSVAALPHPDILARVQQARADAVRAAVA